MICLLDVNVLIALLWPQHEFHARAQKWFAKNANQGWSTCAITESAFIRIVSNPAFSRRAITPQHAIEVLRASLGHPEHHFWSEDLSAPDALAHFERGLVGHQQVTDAYLLGLTIHKKGRLATFDAGFSSLLAGASAAQAHLVLL